MGDRHSPHILEIEEEDEDARLSDFLPGATVRNPAGWRRWVAKVEGNRVYVDFENQLCDDYPPHLLEIVAPPMHLA